MTLILSIAFSSFCSVYIIFKYFSKSLMKKTITKKSIPIFIIAVFALSIVTLIKIPLLNLLAILSLIFILRFVYFKAANKSQIITDLGFLSLFVILETLLVYIYESYYSFIVIPNNIFPKEFSQVLLVNLLLVIFISFLFKYVNVHKISYTFQVTIAYSVFICINIILVYLIIILTAGVKYNWVAFIAIVGLLFSSFLFYYFLTKISKLAEKEKELTTAMWERKNSYQYFNNIEKSYLQNQKIIHDIKNHLFALENLYASNFKDGQIYSRKILESLNSTTMKNFTPTRILNILLNEKYEIMTKNGISFETKMVPIDLLEIFEEIDCVILFGNLLDNAIDNCDLTDGRIKLNLLLESDTLILSIFNTISDKVSESNKIINKEHHGLGLKIIKDIVQKYYGIVTVNQKKKSYITIITFPVENN
ncbi:GHKL domain-containing protein [Listeria innocua]|uniref:GHKL domain-containing protein n=1 Tax=Listeria innocua TaxID=1642 RepID=UPI0016243AE5|nr:GHKL domain-containing protein [Listeria innocua]MBC1910978.1 GHKL domain-containing protein [Listeria innocua]MBC1929060.1 GHKL domain-containing protein [Listeria innocua]